MTGLLRWTIGSYLLLSMGAHAANQCEQGASDLARAKNLITSSADDEATVLLNQSIDECPTYDAYETLAEHLAVSDSPRDHGSAVDAFVAANARAPSARDRAQTLFQYAALLNRNGDPQNAYPLIEQAVSLDPKRVAIRNLATNIQAQVQHPKSEEITRALRFTLYKPVQGGSVRGPSVNIPINFETDSTAADEQTRPNIDQLATALADPNLAGRSFSFIGHSDARGDESYNERLSLQRAQAISQRILELQPQLMGRIHVEGHGAREPIDMGTDEDALRRNRRLQVIAR